MASGGSCEKPITKAQTTASGYYYYYSYCYDYNFYCYYCYFMKQNPGLQDPKYASQTQRKHAPRLNPRSPTSQTSLALQTYSRPPVRGLEHLVETCDLWMIQRREEVEFLFNSVSWTMGGVSQQKSGLCLDFEYRKGFLGITSPSLGPKAPSDYVGTHIWLQDGGMCFWQILAVPVHGQLPRNQWHPCRGRIQGSTRIYTHFSVHHLGECYLTQKLQISLLLVALSQDTSRLLSLRLSLGSKLGSRRRQWRVPVLHDVFHGRIP